jgi:steroid delta-isomerase-like uncharacterized protein
MQEAERRFVAAVWNQGDMMALADTHSRSVVVHWSRDFADYDTIREFVTDVRTGFPDFHMTTEFTVVEDDRITVGFTASGTQERPFRGIPATGRRIQFGGMWTHRFEDGRVVEGWAGWDTHTIREQLGMTFPRVLITLPTILAKRMIEAIRTRQS